MPPDMTARVLNFRRCLIDLFVATLLILFALDTLPCTPAAVRTVMEPLLDATGLWQGTWSLFAPIPDSTNHRLRADLFYADGTHCVWDSPDWRAQSAWQRFVSHRESEFIEKIWDESSSAAWPGFAEYIARRESSLMNSRLRPERVVLSVITGAIPPPEGDVWQSASRPVELDQTRVFFTLIYPD